MIFLTSGHMACAKYLFLAIAAGKMKKNVVIPSAANFNNAALFIKTIFAFICPLYNMASAAKLMLQAYR